MSRTEGRMTASLPAVTPLSQTPPSQPPPSQTPAPQRRDWTASFARRTRTAGGGEITAILALAGATDVITFSGGFPAPETFAVDVLTEIAGRLVADDAAVALQYSPTEGL